MKTFLSRFGALILSVLTGFDRLRFPGGSRLFSNARGMHTQRRQGAGVTRKLRLLRGHGLIIKVQKTPRYQVSAEGRRILTALLSAHAADAARLAAAA